LLQRIITFFMAIPMILSTLSAPGSPDAEVVVNPNATNPFIAQYGSPWISAHRSGAGLAPENTMLAAQTMLAADSFRVDGFEFDVRITKDGRLILLHDPTFSATSNAGEAFGQPLVVPEFYTMKQLQVLNLGENFELGGQYPYRGLRGGDIPESLRVAEVGDVLSYIEEHSDRQPTYIIEIKMGFHWGMKSVDRLYSILKELGILDRTVVGSFWPLLPYYIDWKYPDMLRSASIFEVLEFYYYARTDSDFSRAKAKYVALQLPCKEDETFWPINKVNLNTKEVVNYAHKYNLAVQYFTVDTPELAHLLRGIGGDLMMTDYPDMVWREYGY